MATAGYKPVSIPALPPGVDPALRQFLTAMKESLEVARDQRGNPLDAIPTFRDLVATGLISVKDGMTINGRSYSADQINNIFTTTLPDWITSDTAPPAPTGLIVTPSASTVTLTWNASAFDQHSHTEVWAADSNNISTAVRIGSSTGNTYVDSLATSGVQRYYWIRDVARNGLLSSFNDVNGDGVMDGPEPPVVSYVFDGPDAVLSWPTPTSNLTIQYYKVEQMIASTWTFVAYVGGNIHRSRVDWGGARDYRVTAIDVRENSSAPGTASVVVVVPGPPTLASSSFSGANSIVKWSPPASGSLPVASYRVYDTSKIASSMLVDSAATAYTRAVSWLSKNFIVTAIDSAGNEGAGVTVVSSVTMPSTSSLTGDLDNEYMDLRWVDTPGSLPLQASRVKFGASWAAGTLVGQYATTTCSVRADWVGARVFWVAAVDSAGNEALAVSYSQTISVPPVTSPSSSITDGFVILSWGAVRGSLPIGTYEVRYGASWAAGVSVASVTGTSLSIPANWSGVRTFWVAGIDVIGNVGAAGSVVADVFAPTAPSVTSSISGANAVVVWTPSVGALPIAEYEIRHGATWAAGTVMGRVKGTTTLMPAAWSGSRAFWVAGVDANGTIGAAGNSELVVTATPAPSVTIEVVDNNVLLRWAATQGTLPIATFQLRKGATWAGSSLVGSKDGGFTTVFETVSGVYTYWLAGVDTAGNVGTPASVSATVQQPPDYVLARSWNSTLSGTKSNALLDGAALTIPISTTDTFATHFTGRGWAGPSAQEAAGYPIFIQPGETTGYYEEVFDYGAVLAAMKVTVNFVLATIAGTVSSSVSITTALDSGFATGVSNFTGAQAFATNFRYVKVRVTATATDDKGVAKLSGLTVVLDAKLKTMSGQVVLSTGGAHPQGNIAQDYVTDWVPGTYPAGLALNGGYATSENKIVNGVGPGGNTEPIWVCVDYDVANDGDGGWDAANVPVDSNYGHLFAVFMKTTTNGGTSYWGVNGGVYYLGGGAEWNPYFWLGDLPSLNTWYLAVGYVHPSGYAGGDAGISGLYDMTGTKQLPGNAEWRFAPGQTTTGHRAYHYYNTTGSGLDAQMMARPVIVKCTVAAAASTIQYLLKCAKDPGAAVDISGKFVDVDAITNGVMSSSPSVPVVDFTDIPNPKRFNLFNFSTSGTPVAGTLSYTIRGY